MHGLVISLDPLTVVTSGIRASLSGIAGIKCYTGRSATLYGRWEPSPNFCMVGWSRDRFYPPKKAQQGRRGFEWVDCNVPLYTQMHVG